jgi:hypothetical protein
MRRQAAWWAVSGVGALLCLTRAPGWWLGLGLLVAALPSAAAPVVRRVVARLQARPLRGELAGLVLALLVASALVPDALAGVRPVDHDHTLHYLKAWETWQRLLEHGQLKGWNHGWFAGYPAHYLYPMGGDLWVLLWHGLTFGALGFDGSYAIAVWGMLVLLGYAVFHTGRRLLGAGPAALATVLVLVEPGGFREGGFDFAMRWGVWPQSLSLAFFVLALGRLPGILDGLRARDVAVFGGCLGLAIVCHPLALIGAVAVGVAALVAWGLAGETPAHGRLAGVVRLGMAGWIGVLCSAGWLVPFLASKDYAKSFGQEWMGGFEAGFTAVEGELFRGTWDGLVLLAVLGAIGLVRERRWPAVLVALGPAVLLGAAATDFVEDLRLAAVADSFDNLQYERFVVLLKPLAFLAAAHALLAVARPLGAVVGGVHPVRGAALRGVAALALATWIPGALWGLSESFIEPVEWDDEERPHREDREALVEFAKTLPRDGFYRWGHVGSGLGNSLLDLSIELGAPVYRSGNVAANMFHHRLAGVNAYGIAALRIRYLVSARELLDRGSDSGRTRYGPLKRLKRFGAIRLYEVSNWKNRPFDVFDGPPGAVASVEGVEFGERRVVVRAGPAAGGILRLPFSEFDRWEATHDGRVVPIVPRPARGIRDSGFVSVPLQPGEWRFEFVARPPDTLGFWLCVFGWVAALGLVLPVPAVRRTTDGAFAVLARVAAPLRPFESALGWAALGLGLLSMIVLARAVVPLRSIPEEVTAAPVYDLQEALDGAEVWLREGGGEPEPCPWVLGRFICGGAPETHVTSRLETLKLWTVNRCVAGVPPEGATLEIRWPDVPAGRVIGHFGIPRKKGRDAALRFRLVDPEGAAIWAQTAERDGQVRTLDLERAVSGPLTLEVARRGRRPATFCFAAQVFSEP